MTDILLYFKMNGYAKYIWPSYIVTFFLLGCLYAKVIHRLKNSENKLYNLTKRDKNKKKSK